MDINSDSLRAFRADLKLALAPLREKYGVDIDVGNITYYQTHFSMRLTVTNGTDPDEVARNRFDAAVWKYKYLGLEEGMFNRIFIAEDGERYALRGFNTRARKYPIKIMRVSDGEDRVCNDQFIVKLLNEYYYDSEMSITFPE